MIKSIMCSVPVAAMILSLSACGGGGGSVSSTPAPVPTTPAVSYVKLSDMSGDRTFQTAGIHVTNSAAGFTAPVADTLGNGPVVAYGAASDTYTLSVPGNAPVTFFPSEVIAAQSAPTVPNSLTYAKSTGVNNLRLIVPSVGGVPLSYTLLGTWSTVLPGHSNVTTFLSVGGSPTVASDMPRTGTANYTIAFGGTAVVTNPTGPGSAQSLTGSTGTFAANFGTNAITTSLHLIGSGGADFGTFSGTGTIAAGSAGFSGTFTGTTSSAFAGSFFGPQAVEMGMAYAIGTSTFSAIGLGSGIKQ